MHRLRRAGVCISRTASAILCCLPRVSRAISMSFICFPSQSYVEDMERLCLFFLAPLRRLASSSNPVLTAPQVSTIFGTVDQLVSASPHQGWFHPPTVAFQTRALSVPRACPCIAGWRGTGVAASLPPA